MLLFQYNPPELETGRARGVSPHYTVSEAGPGGPEGEREGRKDRFTEWMTRLLRNRLLYSNSTALYCTLVDWKRNTVTRS
jgi:hypothetical protein